MAQVPRGHKTLPIPAPVPLATPASALHLRGGGVRPILWLSIRHRKERPVTKQPNILLIMSDQLIPMMTGAYGSTVAKTPNLDRLAREGIIFTNAYTSCPICAPARMSLLTGKYVSEIDCNDNTAILATEEPTFGHYLAAEGYDCVLSGKMHMIGPDQLHGYTARLNTDIYPSDMTWLASRVKLDGHSPIHEHPIAIDYVGENAGVRQWSMQLDYDEETHFRALEYLRRKRSRPSGTAQKPLPPRDDRPFMLHVSYQHPHEPFHCTQAYWVRYEGVHIPIPQCPENLGYLHPDGPQPECVSRMQRGGAQGARESADGT